MLGFDPTSGITEFDPSINAPTPQARAVYVVGLDRNVLEEKKSGHMESAALYPRNLDEIDFSIFAKEVLLTLTPRYVNQPLEKKKEVGVFSALNGMFSQGESLIKIYDRIRPFGIAVTKCHYDPRSIRNNKNGLPAQVHGTEQIRNTGPHTIMANDYVIIQLPNPKDPIPVPPLHNGRIVPLTIPYRPHDPEDKNHAFLAENFHYLIRDRSLSSDDPSMSEKGPTSEGARILRKSVLKASLVIIDTLIQSGVLQPTNAFMQDARLISENETREARDAYAPQRDTFLSKLYDAFQMESNPRDFLIRNHKMQQVSLDSHLDNVLFSRSEEYAPYRRDAMTPLPRKKRDIDDAWATWLEWTLKSVDMVGFHFVSRGLGRAMETAAPGEKFKIMLLQSVKAI